MDANPAVVLILIAIFLVAVVGVVYLVFTRKSSPKLNIEKYQTKWLAVENSVSRNNSASWQLAIFNADKLVDLALKERRFAGQTMGERMKKKCGVTLITYGARTKFVIDWRTKLMSISLTKRLCAL